MTTDLLTLGGVIIGAALSSTVLNKIIDIAANAINGTTRATVKSLDATGEATAGEMALKIAKDLRADMVQLKIDHAKEIKEINERYEKDQGTLLDENTRLRKEVLKLTNHVQVLTDAMIHAGVPVPQLPVE